MSSDQPANTPEPRPAAHLARHSPWESAAGLREVAVPLLDLPAGLKFNGDFPEPIRYDPERRALVYRGVMPHASYLYLRALSRDIRFQLAIERLFVETAVRAAPRPRSRPVTAALAVGSLVLAAAGLFWLAPRAAQNEMLDGDPEPPAATADADPEDAPAPSDESQGLDAPAEEERSDDDDPARSIG